MNNRRTGLATTKQAAPCGSVRLATPLPPPTVHDAGMQGVDLEEARMLEAAMFGVAYQGRMPDYNGMPAGGGMGGMYRGGAGGRGAHQPVDPSVLEGRMLREEQELAFQESLEVRACPRSIARHGADLRRRIDLRVFGF